MEPYCHEDYQTQPILLLPLARMMLMIEIIGNDVTMTVEIAMVIEEIKEIVEVVDKSTSGTPCLTSSITHLTCNCGGTDINSTYRQCLVSMRNSTIYFTALTLFDTGAYTSFVNREVAKWLEQQQHGGTVAGVHHVKSSRHDVPTSEVGLAGTQLSSSIYGTIVFDLTFFNEVTKSDNILKSIEANVIDSCVEVIIGLPDIRSHRLIHRIPSYFDSPDPTYLVPLRQRRRPGHCAKAHCIVTTVHFL
jgi:hypothetical protein